ncbi:MAG TPA: macro domain-containing protein [Pseudonocardiaceae bacterium]|nr:macro domain-containing protein [Pseudonocardiaceae bacterium]
MTADLEGEQAAPVQAPRVVLCSVSPAMTQAWQDIADGRPDIEVYEGSILEIGADAVVSPANSFGLMRGGIDAVYSNAWPGIEQRVRSAVLAFHGGELPVGEAVVVATGTVRPGWLFSAPTMRAPATQLPVGTVHPYLAARAVFRLWRTGRVEDGRTARRAIRSIAIPGLGTGVGGVSPESCARQVAAAWDELFADLGHSATA